MILYLVLAVISLVCLGLQCEPTKSYAIWNVYEIHQGQWWRIVTGNLTHTNFAHLAMDLAGLWVICFLFQPKTKSFLLVFLYLSVVVGVSLLFTNITSYLGLSGILHGLFAYYALLEALRGRRSSWLLVIGVVGKVIWEHIFGPSATTSEWIHAPIAIQAHLAGTVGGLVLALLWYVYRNKIGLKS